MMRCSARLVLLLGLQLGASLYLFSTGFVSIRTELPDVSRCNAQLQPDVRDGPSSAAAAGAGAGAHSNHNSSSMHNSSTVQSSPGSNPSEVGSAVSGASHSSTSTNTGHSACGRASYKKAVFIIVDALREDFFFQTETSPDTRRAGRQTWQHDLPRLRSLVHAAGPAALAARFVSGTPTITISRLRAWLTGCVPAFLDIGQSFSAVTLSEDNLLSQLAAAGKRTVFMGDDTWLQLAPNGVFAASHPYPSFNVLDLHTVDDGVWQHLQDYLQRPGQWDVLIAHYLGVDHAGHAHGVNSAAMAAKLQQMDKQMAWVIERLLSESGPGGAHEDTLLIIASDHGQTYGGDHGGGSPEEVNTLLLAFNLQKWWQQQQQSKQPYHQNGQQQQQQQQQVHETHHHVQEPQTHNHEQGQQTYHHEQIQQRNNHGQAQQQQQQQQGLQQGEQNEQQQEGQRTGEEQQHQGHNKQQQHTRPQESQGEQHRGKEESVPQEAHIIEATQQPAAQLISGQYTAPARTSATALVSQLDFTATFALLMGLPIPYSNVGSVDMALWQVLADAPQPDDDGHNNTENSNTAHGNASQAKPEDGHITYREALLATAHQVHRYLKHYAQVSSFPTAAFHSTMQLFNKAVSAEQQYQQLLPHPHPHKRVMAGQQEQNPFAALIADAINRLGMEAQAAGQSANAMPKEQASERQAGAKSTLIVGNSARQAEGSSAQAEGDAKAAGEDAKQAEAGSARQVETACQGFLASAAQLATNKFSGCDLPRMALGSLLLLALLLQLYRHLACRWLMAASIALHTRSTHSLSRWASLFLQPEVLGPLAVTLFQSSSLFGLDWMMAEGRVTCGCAAAAITCLGLRAAWLQASPTTVNNLHHTQPSSSSAAGTAETSNTTPSSKSLEASVAGHAARKRARAQTWQVAWSVTLAMLGVLCMLLMAGWGLMDRGSTDPHNKAAQSTTLEQLLGSTTDSGDLMVAAGASMTEKAGSQQDSPGLQNGRGIVAPGMASVTGTLSSTAASLLTVAAQRKYVLSLLRTVVPLLAMPWLTWALYVRLQAVLAHLQLCAPGEQLQDVQPQQQAGLVQLQGKQLQGQGGEPQQQAGSQSRNPTWQPHMVHVALLSVVSTQYGSSAMWWLLQLLGPSYPESTPGDTVQFLRQLYMQQHHQNATPADALLKVLTTDTAGAQIIILAVVAVLPHISIMIWYISSCWRDRGQGQKQPETTQKQSSAWSFLCSKWVLFAVLAAVAAWLISSTRFEDLMTLPPMASLLLSLGKISQVPYRLLLPRVVYLQALMGLRLILLRTVAAALCARRQRRKQQAHASVGTQNGGLTLQDRVCGAMVGQVSTGTAGSTNAAAATGASSWGLGCFFLAAVLWPTATLLLGERGPRVMLLAMVVLAVCCALVYSLASSAACRHLQLNHARQATNEDPAAQVSDKELGRSTAVLGTVGNSNWQDGTGVSTSPANSQQHEAPAHNGHTGIVQDEAIDRGQQVLQTALIRSAAPAAVGGAITVYAVAAAAFFASGHFCEFTGLQYASPFIGFDDMQWAISPLLMGFNTFGAMLVCGLAVGLLAPISVAAVLQQHAQMPPNTHLPISQRVEPIKLLPSVFSSGVIDNKAVLSGDMNDSKAGLVSDAQQEQGTSSGGGSHESTQQQPASSKLGGGTAALMRVDGGQSNAQAPGTLADVQDSHQAEHNLGLEQKEFGALPFGPLPASLRQTLQDSLSITLEWLQDHTHTDKHRRSKQQKHRTNQKVNHGTETDGKGASRATSRAEEDQSRKPSTEEPKIVTEG